MIYKEFFEIKKRIEQGDTKAIQDAKDFLYALENVGEQTAIVCAVSRLTKDLLNVNKL